MTCLRRQQRMSIAWAVFCSCLLLSLTQAREDQIKAEAQQTARGWVEAGRLLAIEKRVLPPCIVPGPWSQESLQDYYWAANARLKSRFEEARSHYELETRAQPYRAMTLVAGVAGLGKTFIKGHVFNDDYPPQDACKFDIKDLYAQWQELGKSREKPDLFCGKVVINSLMSATRPQDNSLLDHLIKQDAKFYVIDSLDEIHPDDYVWALNQIEEFVFRTGRDFVHVVVFGRPLAFCDYWKQRQKQSDDLDTSLFILNPPQIRTTGDLQVSSWNYHCWRYNLSWSPSEVQASVRMPLHAYEEWTRLGFDRSGFFHTVRHESTNSMTPWVHAELTKWAREHAVVNSMLGNLAGNSILREIVGNRVAAGKPYNERDVMEDYFTAWLVRDTKSDDRPSKAKPEHLDLYMRLLEGVAVKYLQEQRVDAQGFFTVRPNDEITVRHHGRECTFPVKRILNRSGLIFVDPRPSGGDNYRFEPIWLHRLLVEKHNERQDPTIALRTPPAITDK